MKDFEQDLKDLYMKLENILNSDIPDEEHCTNEENEIIGDLCNLKNSIEYYLNL